MQVLPSHLLAWFFLSKQLAFLFKHVLTNWQIYPFNLWRGQLVILMQQLQQIDQGAPVQWPDCSIPLPEAVPAIPQYLQVSIHKNKTNKQKTPKIPNRGVGHLDGSAAKLLPSAQVKIPRSWNWAVGGAPCSLGSLLLPLLLPLPPSSWYLCLLK